MDHRDQNGDIKCVSRCEKETSQLPKPLERSVRRHRKQVAEDGVMVEEDNIRILSWNILSQALGTQNDGFVRCPPEALEWKTRRWRLMEELVRHQPDILCLQEVVKSKLITFCDPVSSQVDHFPLLERALSSLGYEGHFVSKPDSPCIYLPSNSGPDGCALFYKKDQWELVGEVQYKTLEVFNITWQYINWALHCVPETRAVSCSFV